MSRSEVFWGHSGPLPPPPPVTPLLRPTCRNALRYEPFRQLRSSEDKTLLCIPRDKTVIGRNNFNTAAAYAWNELPRNIGLPLRFFCPNIQWRNRRGQSAPPRDFWPGNFCWRIGKRGKEKREKGWKLRRKEGKLRRKEEKLRKKKENCKREGGKLEMEVGKVIKKGWGPFFFFFFFFFHFTFENDGNLFWVYQNGIFYREKAFHTRKKIRGNDFGPSEKYACYAPANIGFPRVFQTFFIYFHSKNNSMSSRKMSLNKSRFQFQTCFKQFQNCVIIFQTFFIDFRRFGCLIRPIMRRVVNRGSKFVLCHSCSNFFH